MKNLLTKTGLATICVSIIFLIASCGGGISTNEHLGKLPGIAKKYGEKIEKKKKELKECTDMQKAFKLDQEIKSLGKEADETIEELLASNPIANVPFEQKAEYQFTVKEVSVKKSSDSRISFLAKVIITEDILNNFGNPPGYAKSFFAYIKAVDKEGNSLTRRNGVMGSSGRGPHKANMEVEINGSLDGPADLENFDKLIFISKDDYKK